MNMNHSTMNQKFFMRMTTAMPLFSSRTLSRMETTFRPADSPSRRSIYIMPPRSTVNTPTMKSAARQPTRPVTATRGLEASSVPTAPQPVRMEQYWAYRSAGTQEARSL